MASEDARYRESSQFKLWSFSHSQLAAIREDTNAKAVASISERLSERIAATASSSSFPAATPNNVSAPTSNANTPDPESSAVPEKLPEFLTAQEEATLVAFYVSELLRAGDHAEFSDEIKATAAVLFRRFYITNSIMTYPPQEMLIVALFFGCKAEGAFPRISDFLKTFQREHPEQILAGEFLLFRGVRFSIDVKHPFRALRGAVMELRSLGDIDHKDIEKAEQRAKQILRFSPLMTDAYFHYTPSQIMMAALSLADRGLAERLIQATFHYVQPQVDSEANTPGPSGGADAPREGGSRNKPAAPDQATIIGSHIRDRVLGTIESCRDMLHKELPERREHWADRKMYKAHILPLRKKLNKCHDPDRWNLVELQRQRREQAAKKADSDDEMGGTSKKVDDDAAVFGDTTRDAKRRKVLAGGAKLDDPFGGPL